ncbi:MAG: VWA domain-containing protein [Terriglobales bacterium]
MVIRRAWCAPLLAAGLVAAQAPQQKAFTFSTHSWLVVEAVTVTNQSGAPVTGLTAKDFVVTENGVRQRVAFCQYQALDDKAAAAAATAKNAPAPPRPATPGPTTIQITPESPTNSQYANRRLIALYFDFSAMPNADQIRALAAARAFIATNLHPADKMAIMEYAGAGVQVKQDFTSNRELLGQAINNLIVASGYGLDENAEDAASSDYGSAFGQDDSEFNVFNTNRQLAALQTAVEMLAPISEKKSLVYFASGIDRQGVDNQAQLEATTNAAIRANVALFPIDARGLVAYAPLGDATQGSPGGLSMYNGGASTAMNLRLATSQDTLYALGSDTGGKALLDNNNLGAGIEHARDAITSYYLIGYYTSNAALDGKYRQVRVALAAPPGAKLAYRTGYYAGKTFAKFTETDKERQLEDALMLGNPITDLTIQLELNYFQLNSAEYFVPIAAKIPGSELALAKKGGARQSIIDFIGEIKDPYGTTISNLRDKVTLKLSGETAAQLAKLPIEYSAGFTLLPGRYSIKLLARDDETGRIGTYMTDFTIPNLMHAADRVPISSVVLSNQRVALAAALFNAKKNQAGADAEAADPLVENGAELMPSVTRVFHRSSPLLVYLQAYEHPGTAPAPLESYVSFYSLASGKLAWQSSMQDVTVPPAGRAGAMPIQFSLPLTHLPAGKYECQVTVLAPATHQANFWRAPIEIRP